MAGEIVASAPFVMEEVESSLEGKAVSILNAQVHPLQLLDLA